MYVHAGMVTDVEIIEFPGTAVSQRVRLRAEVLISGGASSAQGLRGLAVAALRAAARDGRWQAWRARNGRPPPSPPAGSGAFLYYGFTTLRERFV